MVVQLLQIYAYELEETGSLRYLVEGDDRISTKKGQQKTQDQWGRAGQQKNCVKKFDRVFVKANKVVFFSKVSFCKDVTSNSLVLLVKVLK